MLKNIVELCKLCALVVKKMVCHSLAHSYLLLLLLLALVKESLLFLGYFYFATEKYRNGTNNSCAPPPDHKIITTTLTAYAFEYQKDQLESITKRIPSGMKVAVVSVVGAFRTGKSFLLSFFLRYLHSLEHPEEFEDENNNRKEWYELSDSLKSYDGFHWRAGSERDTTGIWMWSHPYIINNVAVLLVDTQGMFDNETTMKLTASIFGLSTLLSSYQIYNVDKMIGEDVLQQLGLFTEYGRVASDNSRNEKQKKKKNNDKPFQKVEFLVRDWQHFEEEEDVVKMAAEMDKVLEKVMSDRDAHDLKETREQIVACFDKITIYGLVHPGFAVTKKSYNGEVDKIEPVFLRLLDQYCRRVFTNLEPKTIHGRQITGPELATFIEAYAEMFKTGADFPAATTMLEATSAASNTNAINLAMEEYKNSMDRVAGPQASNYVKEDELAEDHKQFVSRSLDKFNSIATFGSKSSIEKSKRDLLGKIDKDFEMYKSLNNGRNPLLGLEL